jgi:transposase
MSRVEGLSGREIARLLGVSRNTVAKALAGDDPPRYVRQSQVSKVDPFVPAIRALLVKHPRMKATVIAERVGFNGGVSSSIFRQRVRELKLEMATPDPADRLQFSPGEQVQCDLWFPDSRVEGVDGKPPVLTMVACWSRFLMAVMLPSRQCGDILAGMNVLLGRLGGLPKCLLWDNESGIVHRRKLIPQAALWAGVLGTRVKLAKPCDPETKGRVERSNGWLGTSFEPGREFTSIFDFNTQLEQWLALRANTRVKRATGAAPADLLSQEQAKLLALPVSMPKAVIGSRVRLARDYHVRICSADYSVDPSVIGRFVDVEASLERVKAVCDGRVVADHRRSYTRWDVVTDPTHVQTARVLRDRFQEQARQATKKQVGLPDVEHRDLASYDELYHVGKVAA